MRKIWYDTKTATKVPKLTDININKKYKIIQKITPLVLVYGNKTDKHTIQDINIYIKYNIRLKI